TPQLRQKDGSLPFAETIVRAVTEMAVKPFARQTAAIVDRSRLALKSIIVGNDNAAFAGSHQFAGLKAERPAAAEGADALSAPFAGVRMGAILDERDSFFLCQLFE